MKLVISGLIGNLFIALNTINLQLQGWFVPISLRLLLGVVATYVMATSSHHVVNFFHPVGVSVSIRQLSE